MLVGKKATNRLYKHLMLVWVAIAVPTSVLAQGALPGAVQPGQMEKRLQEPPAPRETPETSVETEELQAIPVDAEKTRFVLKKLNLVGVTVYPPDQLTAEFNKHIDQEITLADVFKFAQQLTIKYRDDGYILTQATVPDQIIRKGEVRVVVSEGYIDDVRFDGNILGDRTLLENYASKIKASKPLKAGVFERYLLLMNDLNGVYARASVTPSGKGHGATDLVVHISQNKFSGSVGVNNRNPRSLGTWWYDVGGDVYAVFGDFDQTGVRLISSLDRKINFLQMQHSRSVGTEGGKISLLASYGITRPDLQGFSGQTLESHSTSAAVTYTYPLIRSRVENLYARGSFSVFNSASDFNSALLSKDRLRALRIGGTYDLADQWHGINIIGTELSQGLNILGETKTGSANLSRVDGRSDFSKVTVYAARLQSLAPNWSLLGAFNGQKAFNNLLSSEQFSFGGEPFGRGYDSAELIGDSGAAFKLELRNTGSLSSSFIRSYTAYAFFDAGKIWRRDSGSLPSTDSATSTGLGVRFSMDKGATGFIEIDKPLTHNVVAANNRRARLFAGASMPF